MLEPNWATVASLIESCKLNAVDPLAYLARTLAAIVTGHKQSRDRRIAAMELSGIMEQLSQSFRRV
jgi:transposase